jgi:predicted DNA-binding protein
MLNKQLVVRVKPEMYEWLKARAKENDRTMGQEVRFILRQSFDKELNEVEAIERGG